MRDPALPRIRLHGHGLKLIEGSARRIPNDKPTAGTPRAPCRIDLYSLHPKDKPAPEQTEQRAHREQNEPYVYTLQMETTSGERISFCRVRTKAELDIIRERFLVPLGRPVAEESARDQTSA